MTAVEIVRELEQLGSESYKRILINHGAREPVLGVKIEALKKIQKRARKDYRLALELYDTGIYDAQYLAGLMADETRMTAKDLRRWLTTSNSAVICGTTVAAVAAESKAGWDLANEWIESKKEPIAQAGWVTLSSLVAIRPDSDLDLPELKRLLKRVERTIHEQPNLVRYAMNGFVISLGSYIKSLTELAIETAERIGPVPVDMGNTACQVPHAPDYIRKIQKRGSLGKKRKSARC